MKITLYYPDDFQEFWRRLKEIADREGKDGQGNPVSRSSIVRHLVSRYVQVHYGGNPQLIIDRFSDDVKHKCYFCEGLFTTPLKRVRFVSGLIAPTCIDCLADHKQRRTVKRVLGVWKRSDKVVTV
jgi:hypothetical protein